MKNTNKGFTLVELIVVITILAILGTIAFISLQGYSQDAKNSKVVSDTRTIITSIETQLTRGSISIVDVVDNSIDLSDTTKNGVSGKFGSGKTLRTDGTYKVGIINFTALKQNGSEFKDNDGNDYIAAVAVSGLDDSFYQVVGQQKNSDVKFTAVVKGNYVKKDSGNVDGLVSVKGANTDGVTNGSEIDNLY